MSLVVHCQRARYDTYIGRAEGERGRYGNPFVLGQHGTRDEVIAMYDGWLRTGNSYCVPEATEARRQDILSHVHELEGQTLGCWCYPKRCHGWTLVALAAERSPTGRKPSCENVEHVASTSRRDVPLSGAT